MGAKRLRDVTWFIGKAVPGHEDYIVRQLLDSGANGCVFIAHSDALARDAACKVVPKENLIGQQQEPPSWRQEITTANRVSSSRVVRIFAIGTWDTPEGDCLFMLSDFVKGKSLRKYLKDEKSIDISFVVTLMEELLDFIRELNAGRFAHGDLHSGNVLVEDRSDALTGPPYGFRMTDFGVAPATTGATLLDDIDQVAKLLREALLCVDYQSLLPRDRVLFEFLRDEFLGKRLLERDKTFSSVARDPVELFKVLADARKVSARAEAETRRYLTTPFDYLSCEQIGEAHVLLKELYSDKMLGLLEVEDLNNLVLTGPRGCGKTTLFRCLSLKHRVRTDDDGPGSVKYIGVYYRCDDLYFNFPRYRIPSRQEGIDVPMHFLTVTLLRELLESLALWLPRHCDEATWARLESESAKEMWDVLGLKKPEHPSAHTFRALVNALERERERAARKQRMIEDRNQKFGTYFGPEMLSRSCAVLSGNFQEISSRPIFFLIDDYSTPKISGDLQRNLNRLAMQRTAFCFFKLATESPTSFVSSDVDGKAYVEGREFRLVNLGMDFINASAVDKLRFVDDVFNKRFSYAESFPIKTLQDLVGDDPAGDYNEVARQFRDGKRSVVWGRSALAELCSGDVHFLIDLAGKMVTAAGGASELKLTPGLPAINAEVQFSAIRKEGGRFLKNLRALPDGQRLVEVVEAFGSVAASYIRHRDSKNEGGAPPHQATRIETYENPNLRGQAKEVYDDLLRYSVFLEDVRGKSRRGMVVPRLYLRRFLIPFFNLTFSKRDSLELSVGELNELLLNPKQFEARNRLKTPDDRPSDMASNQLPLLPSD